MRKMYEKEIIFYFKKNDFHNKSVVIRTVSAQ